MAIIQALQGQQPAGGLTPEQLMMMQRMQTQMPQSSGQMPPQNYQMTQQPAPQRPVAPSSMYGALMSPVP